VIYVNVWAGSFVTLWRLLGNLASLSYHATVTTQLLTLDVSAKCRLLRELNKQLSVKC